jgi:cell wall-associated NlpC family hydrolase
MIAAMVAGCTSRPKALPAQPRDTVRAIPVENPPVIQPPIPFNGNNRIETGGLQPSELLDFAETLLGTTYLYGSTDPSKGFDCSGFITYVFNHFNIAVPRSSVDFTNIETEIPLSEARPGDLVLFTGTDTTNPEVGHMGIIRTVSDSAIDFIHSSSGKAYGVTITPLNPYYMSRFVKVIRIFPG